MHPAPRRSLRPPGLARPLLPRARDCGLSGASPPGPACLQPAGTGGGGEGGSRREGEGGRGGGSGARPRADRGRGGWARPARGKVFLVLQGLRTCPSHGWGPWSLRAIGGSRRSSGFGRTTRHRPPVLAPRSLPGRVRAPRGLGSEEGCPTLVWLTPSPPPRFAVWKSQIPHHLPGEAFRKEPTPIGLFPADRAAPSGEPRPCGPPSGERQAASCCLLVQPGAGVSAPPPRASEPWTARA